MQMPTDRASLEALIRGEGLPFQDVIIEHIQPAAALIPGGAIADDSAASRLGGRALMATGEAWPRWQGSPLAYIGHIDLADLDGLDTGLDLPSAGHLTFYYENSQQTWGFDPKDRGSFVVRRYPESADLTAVDFPEDLSEDARFAPLALAPQQVATTVGFEAPELEARGLTWDQCRDLYGSLEWADPEPRCLVGGHPDPMQGDMKVANELTAVEGIYTGAPGERPDMDRIIARALDWQLLFQVPSAEDAGMMWGDLGNLYYWIRKEDLAARRFEAVWLQLQCG